jgi:ABC-type oligopeptide transport system ATPase subunit
VSVFQIKPAVREQVPVMVGLMGASGSGKTFSALRLAAGIQRVTGGDVCVIDTESRRALHYADDFKFMHMQFDAPFGPLRYLEAIKAAYEAGARTIVVDSMSHEHEGPGGVLEMHDREVQRLGGGDRHNFPAWAKPKAERRQMINGILQVNANFIFCFRAKEKTKPGNEGGKKVLVEQGYMPIAGEEFVFEMTMNALLLPGSAGVPVWQSEYPGERAMMKLPRQFISTMADGRQLDEGIGQSLAEWARGKAPTAAVEVPAEERERLAKIEANGYDAADMGMPALVAFWSALSKSDKAHFLATKETSWKPRAEATTAAAA